MTAATVEQLPGKGAARRGSHRDRALATWRRTRSVELKIAGHSYQEIAEELGYANRGTVHKIIKEALAGREADAVDMLRQVEVDRLNALQAAVWSRAIQGHLPSIAAAQRLIEARCKVLGLDVAVKKDPKASWVCCQGPQTVVIRTDDCRWMGCKRHGHLKDTSAREPSFEGMTTAADAGRISLDLHG